MLYELLTARKPFPGKTTSECKRNILRANPRLPTSICQQLDRRLEAIVLKCLASDPDGRYITATALADDLICWLRDEPTEATPEGLWRRTWRRIRRRPALTAVAGGLLVLAAAGAVGVEVAHHLRQAAPLQEDPRVAELQRLQNDIAGGDVVKLLRPGGSPRWSRPLCGGDKLLIDTRRGQGLMLESVSPVVLELFPDPPASFTCSALVESNGGKPTCEVGLCVALAERVGRAGLEQFFCLLVLTTEQWDSPRADEQQRPLHLAAFRLKRFSPADKELDRNSSRKFNIDRRGVFLGEKQRLDLVVTPGQIDAMVAGNKLGSITWQELASKTHHRLPPELIVKPPPAILLVPAPEKDVGPLEFKPVFGLYVSDGSAEFHNVTIKALPAQP
jgi:hypothetical protein